MVCDTYIQRIMTTTRSSYSQRDQYIQLSLLPSCFVVEHADIYVHIVLVLLLRNPDITSGELSRGLKAPIFHKALSYSR